MRDRLADSIKDAMRARDQLRLSTLRLMSAALKDHDIARRSQGDDGELAETEIWALFAKMVRQREESARAYEEGGRMDMAERERAEQAVIREFLPKPMSDAEIDAAVVQAIRQTGAQSIRDMGRVMGALKGAHAGRMDFGQVGARVKAALG
ncbi:MAG TPA: GatB/YqeY domain-containing protein [Paracoccaceae bacterium]|nr:GatB/YqeY domain-containing protein [Paracoccaceae bacterium]